MVYIGVMNPLVNLLRTSWDIQVLVQMLIIECLVSVNKPMVVFFGGAHIFQINSPKPQAYMHK